jgi:hypothetical protein
MSKFYNFRPETINGVTIPAGTALRDLGDGAMPQMLRFELPTSLHHCGMRHIDLYPHQVGDSALYDEFAAAMRDRP